MQLSPSLQSQTISKDLNLKTSKEKIRRQDIQKPVNLQNNSHWQFMAMKKKQTHSKVSPTLAQKQKNVAVSTAPWLIGVCMLHEL